MTTKKQVHQKKPIVITLINEKGGIGKTTIATTLATGLAIRGHRVLLIDSDMQGHSTLMMGEKKFGGFYRLLAQDALWKEVTREIPPERWLPVGMKSEGKLFLLPSNRETRAIPQVIDDALALRERIEELEGSVDIIIIDTNPTGNMAQVLLYMATDYIIIPTQTANLSIDSVAETVRAYTNVNKQRKFAGLPLAKLLGVQPNMAKIHKDGYTKNTWFYYDLLCEHFPNGTIWRPITLREAWEKATAEYQNIFVHSTDTKALDEAWAMVAQVERVINA